MACFWASVRTRRGMEVGATPPTQHRCSAAQGELRCSAPWTEGCSAHRCKPEACATSGVATGGGFHCFNGGWCPHAMPKEQTSTFSTISTGGGFHTPPARGRLPQIPQIPRGVYARTALPSRSFEPFQLLGIRAASAGQRRFDLTVISKTATRGVWVTGPWRRLSRRLPSTRRSARRSPA